MKLDIQQTIKAVILFLFPAVIIKYHVTGEINKLINRDYDLLSQSAAVIFLFLFIIQLKRLFSRGKAVHEHSHTHECNHGCDHKHIDGQKTVLKVVSYSILVFPLLTGFMIPPRTLDASIAEKKGVFIGASEQPSETKDLGSGGDVVPNVVEGDQEGTHEGIVEYLPDEEFFRNLVEKLRTRDVVDLEENFGVYSDAIHTDPAEFIGKEIAIRGFVYKEDGFTDNQLVISRFFVTHCIADAGIVGFFSQFEGAKEVQLDSWIEATGTIDLYEYNGFTLPRLNVTNWKVIEEPETPYVYPQ